MGVSEIFSLGGQSAYRRFEMECLEQTIERTEPGIIEVGGSLVSEPLAYERLLSSCITIWLRASPEDHMNRVIAQGDIRPMANNNHAMEDLQRILSEREILYKRANYVIDTSGDRVSDTVNECLKLPAVNEILRTVGKVQP
jgi:XRE family aerobic/anaerobic benzoate catabolism transcriptional regulator